MMSGRDVTRLSSLTFVAPAHRPLPLPGSAAPCRTGPPTTGNYPWRLASELTAQKKAALTGCITHPVRAAFDVDSKKVALRLN
jgi:hypothetical protein